MSSLLKTLLEEVAAKEAAEAEAKKEETKETKRPNVETTKKAKVLKEFKNKGGVVFAAGSSVGLNFKKYNSNVYVVSDEGAVAIPYKNASKYLSGFKAPPSEATLKKQANDSIATTPLGNRTELDGHGPEGEPSWFLILGLI
jgi:hypothetical protein